MQTRWQTTLWIMFVAQFLSAIGFSIIFPFLPLYVAYLGVATVGDIALWSGLVFSLQALTMAIAAPIWGSLADRFGYKLMVERAMYGGAIILLLMGFARSAEELTLLRAIQGMITGTISAANALVATVTPRERMGFAMGTLQMGLWSGTATGPLIGGLMAETLGFRATFITTAALLLVSGILVTIGVRGGRPAPVKPKQQPSGMLRGWLTILRTPGIGPTYGMRFLSSLAQTILLPFAPLFIASLLSAGDPVNAFTGLIVGVSSAAGTATAIWLGRLGDRIGHRQVLMGSALLAGLTFAPQGLASNVWQLLILQALSGAAIGGITPSLSALLGRYTATGNEGAVYGLDSSIVSAARAVAPLFGALVVGPFGYGAAFAVSSVACFAIGIGAARLPTEERQIVSKPT
ncbi:MFS transporter [Chloroflexus aggregans]|uniref:Major facilitator superfamily MFS_1 n=1 Tax=Chloroflexus aggregans (strain MD-66 / DSM 9485) TaxID=326427 RepID=B8G501_CHLAD|nr:MFS transporter [Chloroflexus aggregans]ACL23634.1 major facilitator superfamily MFS_1 [Chloroflexus aggregans DSM 9485]